MDYQYLLGSFFLAAATIGVFLGYVLITEQGMDTARKWLVGLLVVMVLVLIDAFVISVKLYRIVPHALFLFSSFWLAIPGLMFLYTRYYAWQKARFNPADLLHFTPFVIYLWLSLDFYFLPAENKIRIGDYFYSQSSTPGMFSMIFFGQSYLYLIWVHLMKKNIGKTRRQWLNAFWRIWFVVVVFDTLLSVASLIWEINVSLGKDISILCYSFQAYFIAYHLLKRPRLFFTRLSGSRGKYRSSSASLEQLESLATATKKLMEEDRLFLNASLRQNHLARRLNTNTVILSQMFDTVFSQNFNEWVNAYRVAHARKLIAQGYLKRYSIEALAEASGYGNKVSFYRHFRRITGKTPQAYNTSL